MKKTISILLAIIIAVMSFQFSVSATSVQEETTIDYRTFWIGTIHNEISLKDFFGFIFSFIEGKEDRNQIKMGDVDADGRITAADARLCLRLSVGLEPIPNNKFIFSAADMDKDGIVSVADARVILRSAIGLV